MSQPDGADMNGLDELRGRRDRRRVAREAPPPRHPRVVPVPSAGAAQPAPPPADEIPREIPREVVDETAQRPAGPPAAEVVPASPAPRPAPPRRVDPHPRPTRPASSGEGGTPL